MCSSGVLIQIETQPLPNKWIFTYIPNFLIVFLKSANFMNI